MPDVSLLPPPSPQRRRAADMPATDGEPEQTAALLGAMLLSTEQAKATIAAGVTIKPADLQQVYAAIKACVDADIRADVVNVADELTADGLLDGLGGIETLIDLMKAADPTFTKCARCPRQSALTLGTEALCAPCTERLLGPIRARVGEREVERDPFGGHGRQEGPLRLDWGADWANLRCDRCGATWVGVIGEPCDWCDTAYATLVEMQRNVLLRPDLPAPDMGAARKRAESAWAERLGRAVAAGIVTEAAARGALTRELARSAEFSS